MSNRTKVLCVALLAGATVAALIAEPTFAQAKESKATTEAFAKFKGQIIEKPLEGARIDCGEKHIVVYKRVNADGSTSYLIRCV